MSRTRAHLSYANVMATIAVFIALGGTSYAVSQLPRNSVGPKQIRAGSVGASELHGGAVRSSKIRDRSVALRDVSLAARESLRGQEGPAGPPGPRGFEFSAAVKATGEYVRTRGISTPNAGHLQTGHYSVRFNSDVSQCYAVASVAGLGGTEPENGEIVTSIANEVVTVRTRNSSGAPTDLPFHLIVSC
jgi:hypothetical protein